MFLSNPVKQANCQGCWGGRLDHGSAQFPVTWVHIPAARIEFKMKKAQLDYHNCKKSPQSLMTNSATLQQRSFVCRLNIIDIGDTGSFTRCWAFQFYASATVASHLNLVVNHWRPEEAHFKDHDVSLTQPFKSPLSLPPSLPASLEIRCTLEKSFQFCKKKISGHQEFLLFLFLLRSNENCWNCFLGIK